jgi:hypothetical protein
LCFLSPLYCEVFVTLPRNVFYILLTGFRRLKTEIVFAVSPAGNQTRDCRIASRNDNCYIPALAQIVVCIVVIYNEVAIVSMSCYAI